MGLQMAQRLLEANLPLTAYNRTEAKLDPLREAGAAIACDQSLADANYSALFTAVNPTD